MLRKAKILLFLVVAIGVTLTSVFYFSRALRSGVPGIEDPMLKKIHDRGTITIGTEATYPPMESIDETGEFIGIDIDIAREIAADLGVEANFQNIGWEELFDAVKEGKVDMIISAITITPERAQTLAFSDPYFNAGQVIVTKKDMVNLIKGAEDLKDRGVGAQIETTSETEAKKYTDSVVTFENYNLALGDLLEGKVEAIVIDYPAALGMVAENEGLAIVGEPFTQEFYGTAVQIGQDELLGRINATIRRLKQTGELKKLEERWLTP